MNAAPHEPTVESVTDACAKFDIENQIIEEALADLFTKYPHNLIESHVLLKVVALNSLYSTQIHLYNDEIPDIWDIVHHIIGLRIGDSLDLGSADVVGLIANIHVGKKKPRCNYSFATKYCSWHSPSKYPIWDSRVDEYLWALQKHGQLSPFHRSDLWDYPKFRLIVTELRDRHGLGQFSFKQIDKFLYVEGGRLLNARSEMPGSEGKPETNAATAGIE